MKEIIASIEKSIEFENWYAALILALIIPDISGELEGKAQNKQRYIQWFDIYLKDRYEGSLSGQDCYALRCSITHNLSEVTGDQPSREILDRIVFLEDGSHKNRISGCFFGDPNYDGKEILQLSVKQFCLDMVCAAKKFLGREKNNPVLKANMAKTFKIEKEINMGGLRIK